MKNYFIANGEVLNTNMSIEEMELRVQETLDESTSGMAQFQIQEISEKEIRMFFVVNQGSQRYYIQVAYDMTSEEKQKQELNSFRNIPDSFKKIVIVNGTKKPWRNEEGFVIMGMKYFLLNADSLEL